MLMYRIYPHLVIHDVQAGDRAPSFEVGEDGSGLALSDFEGKWVLLNFWATWCLPCTDEMPALNRLHNALETRDFVVVGVSIDEDAEAYRQFLQTTGVSFPTARDPSWQSMIRYGTSRVPETYLINPQGIVVRKYVNWQNWDSPEIVNYLRSLL